MFGAALAQTTTTASAQGAPTLSEIIVTAQRRGESLQSVPISVSAATGEMLENMGVRSTSDLSLVAPSMRISSGLGGAVITVRGVGGTGAGVDESANSVYIDGVYQPSPTGALFAFNNVERIEVLKGPQGTLFGRNASGGLLHIITKQPQFAPEGRAELGYGNYETFTGNVYATGPLSDSVAVDFAGNFQTQGEGWGRNLTTGQDTYKGESQGARSKILWNIADDTSFTGSLTFARTFAPAVQGSQIFPGQLMPATGGRAAPGFFDSTNSNQTRVGTEQLNGAGTFKHRFDFATFTSITSRDRVKWQLTTDVDLSPVPATTILLNFLTKTWTQEFQLASNEGSRLQWVGGLYYYDSRRVGSSRLYGTAVNSFTPSRAQTKSYAAYGQATWPIFDTTRVTAGLRYTADRLTSQSTNANNPAAPVVQPRLELDADKITWRLAVDQDLSENILAYASYSRGFKSGLFNANLPQFGLVEPQTTDATEIGIKSEFFDHRLRINAAAFYNEVENLQVKGIPAGAPTPIFYNAVGATFKGLDLEVQAAPIVGLNVQASVALLDGEYKNGFTNALFYTVPPAPGRGLVPSIGNASGRRPPLAAEVVATLSAQYEFPVSMGSVVLAGSYSYNSGYYYDPQDRAEQPEFTLLNASIAWKATDRLEFRVWGENLGDEKHYSNIEPGNSGDNYFAAPPRTFGATVSMSFN